MNYGIGTDIEDVNKFKDLTIEKDFNFLKKIFTKLELNYSFSKNKSYLSLAGRFVAKEAIYKALSSIGINHINLIDIEIINDEIGLPHANILKVLPFKVHINVSFSHCDDKAVAFALIEKIE